MSHSREKFPKLALSVDVSNFPEGSSIRFDFDRGEVYGIDSSGNKILTSIDREYYLDRDRKPKYLTKMISPSGTTNTRIDDYAYFSHFNHIFVIDTNRMNDLHITCYYDLFVNENSDGYSINGNGNINFFVFKGIYTNDSEKFAWRHLLRQSFTKRYRRAGPVALLTDAHFSSIESYNSREAPIIDHYMLPTNVSLIYATADRLNSPANDLIRFVDNQANRLKRAIACEEVEPYFAPLSYTQGYCAQLAASGVSLSPDWVPKSGFKVGEGATVQVAAIMPQDGG